MSEYVKKETGGKTRLYTADKGSMRTIQPHIQIGLIEPIEIEDTNPWVFLNQACQGNVRNPKGEWVKGDLTGVGMVAFESMRGIAEELLLWLADKAGEGTNIGGGGNINFAVKDSNVSLNIGGSNQSHYKIVQDRMSREIWRSQKLPVPYLLWTTSPRKDDSELNTGKVVGPDIIGGALTENVPRWFTYTMRLGVKPARGNDPEKHELFLGTSVDQGAGNATTLGNMRLPLDAKQPEKIVLEPASITKALQILQGKEIIDDAVKKLEARLRA